MVKNIKFSRETYAKKINTYAKILGSTNLPQLNRYQKHKLSNKSKDTQLSVIYVILNDAWSMKFWLITR